jgi:hypothetical protein
MMLSLSLSLIHTCTHARSWQPVYGTKSESRVFFPFLQIKKNSGQFPLNLMTIHFMRIMATTAQQTAALGL